MCLLFSIVGGFVDEVFLFFHSPSQKHLLQLGHSTTGPHVVCGPKRNNRTTEEVKRQMKRFNFKAPGTHEGEICRPLGAALVCLLWVGKTKFHFFGQDFFYCLIHLVRARDRCDHLSRSLCRKRGSGIAYALVSGIPIGKHQASIQHD